MTLLGKNWKILNRSDKSLKQKLLENRGLSTQKEIAEFLNPETGRYHSPYLFGDMEKAVKRITKAIADKERIIVFGDYDVDGITGAAILVKTLQKLGAKVSYRLPHRVEDGYGLKEKFIKEFAEINVKLIITVDCGISCVTEVDLADKKGIDVIITDHHAVPASPPKAFAIIHPLTSKYPCEDLTGAGVAFKLAQALIGEEAFDYIDLAAMGTVADIGLLKGENRLMVKNGLIQLSKTKSAGLKYLKKIAGIDDANISTRTIGFHIGPRINAAGRIDNPYFALQLLLNENEILKGQASAKKLEELNQKRQEMLRKALFEAESMVDKNNFIFIQEHKDWHVGILGLIAGRLVEKYGIPVIILQDLGERLTASARSPECFNIIEALTANSEFLTYFGGHARAAGFDIKKNNYPKFKKALEKRAASALKNKNLMPVLNVECEIQNSDINKDIVDFIEKMKPFGAGNEEPNFLLKGINIKEINLVGKEKTHLKITAQGKDGTLNIIAFRFGEHLSTLRQHKKIDLVCNIEKNTWNRVESIQLKATDIRMA